MKYYAPEQIGPSRAKTPEGFLLCRDVPIARTGEMIYGPDETPVAAGRDGLAHVTRDEIEVFRPETVASFSGKSVVYYHPEVDVDPDNWRELTVGVVLDPRRGGPGQEQFLIADLLLTSKEGIEAVEKEEITEVSCGYDCDYEQTGDGTGRQSNIIGNHVALVQRGRCGWRCAIGDSAERVGEAMRWSQLKARVRDAFKAKDEKAFEEAMDSAFKEAMGTRDGCGDAAVYDAEGEENFKKEVRDSLEDIKDKLKEHDKKFGARDAEMEELKKKVGDAESEEEKKATAEKKTDDDEIEEELEEEAPEGAGDKARKARDSAYLVDSYQETVALSEIVAPGLHFPTFDRAASPRDSYRQICGLRRRALDRGYLDEDTRSLIDDAAGHRTFDAKKMTCDAVRTMFRAVASAKKRANNLAATRDRHESHHAVTGNLRTPADLNKRNREIYGG